MKKRDLKLQSSDERPMKKPKVDDNSGMSVFDDASKELRWTDIERTLDNVDESEPGWIMGSVFMNFKVRAKSDAQLNFADGRQFKVSISCPEFPLFKFSIGQVIKLSLRGARVVKTKSTSAPNLLPFSLVFSDAAAVKFVNGGKTMKDGEVVDVWQIRAEDAINDESFQSPVAIQKDWFSTPLTRECAQHADEVLEALARESSESGPPFTEAASSPSTTLPETPGRDDPAPAGSSITVSNGDEADGNAQENAISHDYAREDAVRKGKSCKSESGRESSTAVEHKSKRKKRDTRYNSSREKTTETRTSPSVSENISEPAPEVKLSKTNQRRRKRASARAAAQNPPSPSPPKRNPALDFVAGVTSEDGAYPALGEVMANQFVHLVGVVVAIDESMTTRTGDSKISITLVDPSKFQYGAAFKVTCFMKSGYAHFLPSPAKGHVVLLRNVRTSLWFGNINGVVYADRLKWIAYNPSTGKVYFSPEAMAEKNPFGSAFEPFHRAKTQEIAYFVRLGEWWRAVKEEEERGAIEIEEYTRNRREHRLIGDCNVNEFFNATVEIVKCFDKGEHDQTLLLLSDYTPHGLRSTAGPYGQWAVSALSSRIEAETSDRMTDGSYWAMNNIRLKIGTSGYLEIDLFAAEYTKLLPEDEEDAKDVHLQALLKRKGEYLKEHPPESEGGRHPVDGALSTISDISGNGYYSIIAELLYRITPKAEFTDLYVTDYTENSLLAAYKPVGLKRVLNDQSISVFHIGTWDEPEFMRDMENGSIYHFADVRISTDRDGGFKGNLKFASKRITKVNIRKSENPAVVALLKRKEALARRTASESPENQADTLSKQASTIDCKATINPVVKSRHTDQPMSTIKDINESGKCPNKHRLVARIVDFYPMDISDFAVQRCRNCKKLIPKNRYACTMCEDMSGEFVEWVFRFFFILEDKNEDRIMVDACSEAKLFFASLNPCDLRQDHEALMAVKRRLRGCLGNLVEVHEGLKRQEVIEAKYCPYLDLAIKSWELDDGDRKQIVYSLTGCEVVEPSP